VNRTLTLSELIAHGEKLGRSLPPRAIVTFEGDLGAGKTTLAQAIARGLGVAAPATSPTYALVHRYRLRSTDEAADLDWEGLLRDGDALLIEWPERAGAWLPDPTNRFRLRHVADPERRGLEGV
jgi:tRNA threonylcarbamoyladenosine biosynthesis protein TsaE